MNDTDTDTHNGADTVATDDVKRKKERTSRRRPWWLKLLRGCGWVLLSLVVAVIIICSAVVWVLSPDQLTPIIERVASKNLKADVSIGRAELTFWSSFPEVKIEIDDMKIVSRSLDGLTEAERRALPADADSLMSVGHFSGGVNMLHIIGGKITVYDVELNRPSLNLIQVNDTVSNFDIFPSTPSDTTSTPLPEITINHFAITDARPIRYRSLADSVNVTVKLRTISLRSHDAPRYELELDTRIETPLLRDVAYETAKFSLDGSINWSAKEPSRFNIDDLKFKLQDEIDLTLSTSVDIGENIKVDRLDMSLRNLEASKIVTHLPRSLRDALGTLDTDMSLNLTARLLRPYVIADSITVPWMDATVSIPDCHINYRTVDFRHFAAEIKAEVNGDDLNKSMVNVERLDIDGKSLDVSVSGTVTSLLDDPLIRGTFAGAIDFDQLPPIVKKNLGGRLTGSLDANTKFRMRLSDFDRSNFHRASIDGEVNLRNVRYTAADTLTDIYSRRAQLTFGTGQTLTHNDNRIDSMLVVKVNVDTAFVSVDGTTARLRNFRAGLGSSNVATSSDTTQINPFGGGVHLDDFYCMVEKDSMRVRMRNIDGFASLRRYNGEKRVPQLELRLKAGKLRMMQPMFLASLTDTKLDVTAHFRPRRKDRNRGTDNAAVASGALKDFAGNDTARNSLRNRILRLTAEQIDSAGMEVIDFNVDNSLRSLLRRWNVHGTMHAQRGRLRLPHLKLRNNFSQLDLAFTTDSVELRNLDYRFGHSDFKVKGIVSNIKQALSRRRPGPVKIDFEILSDSINVNEIVSGLANAGAARGEKAKFEDWAHEELVDLESPEELPDSLVAPILIPVNIDATLGVKANKVIYSDLVFDNFTGELLINRGMVNLHNLSADTEVGKINVGALYSAPTVDKINFGLAMDLQNFHIARLPQVVPALDSIVPMIKDLSGVVNAQIAVTSDITPDMYFNIPTLKAAMQFTGDSLEVYDNSTLRSLAKWLMFKNKKRTVIDHLNLELTIDNGVLNLYPFILDIDRYKLGVMGYNDLDFNLNYHIAVLKSPIPFRFGINIKGMPGHIKIRLGGPKFKENMVAQRDSIAVNTRISLLSEINGAFRRGYNAARLGPLRIQGDTDNSYMQQPDEVLTPADSLAFIREGLIEVPDSVVADLKSRTNTPQDEQSGKRSNKNKR